MEQKAWLKEKILCMCTKCKGAIVQLWHIVMAHCADFGIWQSDSFIDSSDDDEDITSKIQRTAIESMPHYSMVSGQRRQDERIHQERLQAHFEGKVLAMYKAYVPAQVG